MLVGSEQILAAGTHVVISSLEIHVFVKLGHWPWRALWKVQLMARDHGDAEWYNNRGWAFL